MKKTLSLLALLLPLSLVAQTNIQKVQGTNVISNGNIVIGNGTSLSVTGNGSITATALSGTITNAQLTNNSISITAGTGLSGGGSVALGGTTTLTNTGVTSVIAGTGITVSGSTGAVTINSTATGTVTSVSATGNSGVLVGVGTATTTPAISIGLGNITPISDTSVFNGSIGSVTPNTGIFTTLNASGIMTLNSYGVIKGLLETATVTASAPSSTTNFDLITQSVQIYTTNATANFTLNIRGNSTTTLNSMLAIGQSATLTLLVTTGTSAYYPTAYQIDGSAITPKWAGGTAPTSGDASSIDVYTLTILKTASATYTVLASQSQFK